MIDTHAHIYLDKFDKDLENIIKSAEANGVAKIFMPNIDSTTIESMYRVEELYPEQTAAMMGLHPCSVKSNFEEELEIMSGHLAQRTFIAIGEIGIDLYWDDTFYEEQIKAFRTQAEWALRYDLPIVIHSRESIDIILDLLEKWNFRGLTGVFHCFGGTRSQLDRIRALNFMIGIGGVITFKNSDLRDTLSESDLDMIILETDAPYLAPVPYRGKRNEPAYIPIVAQSIAGALNIGVEVVAAKTTENALKLFRMSHFYQKSGSDEK